MEYDSGEEGEKVTALEEPQEYVPLTVVPDAVSEKADWTEPWFMASLKATLMPVPMATPVAALAGEHDATAGGTLSPVETLISSTSEEPYPLSKLSVPSAWEVTVATLTEFTMMSNAVLAFMPLKVIAVVPPVEARLNLAD